MRLRYFRPCKEDDGSRDCGSRTIDPRMRRELILTGEPIDERALLGRRAMSEGMGAVVCFVGVVRGNEDGQPVAAIEYEAFRQMAEHQFGCLFDELERRWPVESVRVVHRLGAVPATAPSLWVEVIAPHREEAFAACLHLVDRMKQVVPIWKKPKVLRDGGTGLS